MAFGSRFPFIYTPGVPSTQPFIFTTGPVNQPFIFNPPGPSFFHDIGRVNQPFIFQTDNSRAGSMIVGNASLQNANFMGYYNDLFGASQRLSYGWAGIGGWNGNYSGFGF
ncbi:hypothetical protein DYH09_12610 [bacterium CPR1]|nr:hypothetical protein [bacterium CPR1]